MRIGLVGYGKGGRFFHAPLIASLTDATFVGVVTRSPERRQALACDYPQVQAFASLSELVAAGVDVVAISTPLAARHGQILEAIELGVSVVSDKPFAQDQDQARELIEAARQRGVLLSVYQNRRWDSDFLTVRKLIDSGALGRVARFESSVERYSPTSVGKLSGGGVLRDLGSHLVDQAQLLFGPVQQVYAELQYATPHHEVDHSFFVALTHASGVVSHLSGSCLQNCPRPRFRISGSNGCYTVDGLDVQEEQALAGHTPLSIGDNWGVEEHRRWGWFEHGEHRERVPSERGCWLRYYQQLQMAVDTGAANPVDPLEALNTTRVLDAARQSASKGCVVTL
ncbi:oxidoreductase [Pseudomonas sp. Leaf127]|uniref:Gfo/Idh/MocA family protein n=1 Tax=Pseudomonas sp. Leaf127 TaxID=1736267 RepID=UPI000702A2C1|nr:Gfo/Idh/MocA family oxidoreductase [Pseudomonas sp. Leaf127]KQQ54388.1 oxidoreductase [Pseudomonas sp. Leaf127]